MSSNEWNIWKIGDIGRIVTGKTPPTQNLDNFGDKYPFITPRDMLGQKQIRKTERYLSEEGKNTVKNCLLPAQSVCVSCIGSDMGKVAMTTTDSISNQQLNSVICKSHFDPDFIYYALLNISDEFRNVGHHSTAIPILNKNDFSNFEITAPDIVTQRRIADILSALDEKIELNRRTNATLEAIAQAVFKEWFVDFNFPNSTGEMVESELGMIPRGWRINEVTEVFEVKDGTHDSPRFTLDGYYLITSKHLRQDGQIDFFSANRISEEDFNNINRRSKVDHLDILYSMIGTVGNILLVGQSNIDFAIKNIGLFKTSQRPDIVLYMNYYMRCEFSEKYFRERLSGSTQQYVTLKTLRELPVLMPDENTIFSFNKILWPIFEKIQTNLVQAQILNQTRDRLLPKLMSGEIEV